MLVCRERSQGTLSESYAGSIGLAEGLVVEGLGEADSMVALE